MEPLARLVLELLDALTPEQQGELRVRGARVEVPIESRIEPRAGLRATLPRGRLQTGFSMPIGQLRFRVGEATGTEGRG